MVSKHKPALALYQALSKLRAVRVVGFAARAAYLLGYYHPSLEGIYLAFSNAGFGASLANIFLVTAVWCARRVLCLCLCSMKVHPRSCVVRVSGIKQLQQQWSRG